jgi:hypothetical protein
MSSEKSCAKENAVYRISNKEANRRLWGSTPKNTK